MAKNGEFVGIGSSIAGIFVAVTMFVGVFMPENAWVLAPIAVSFASMGIGLGYFASKKRK